MSKIAPKCTPTENTSKDSSSKEPLTTQEKEFCNSDTELQRNKDVNKLSSSIVCSIQLLLLLLLLLLLRKKNLILPKRFCKQHTELLQKYYLNWIEYFSKPDYLQIIYLLTLFNITYASGITKIFGGDTQNIKKLLLNLQKYGILEEINAKKSDKNYQKMQKIKDFFNLSQHHFNQARFYKLTELGMLFYKDTPFDEFLPEYALKHAKNWQKKLKNCIRDYCFILLF